MGLAQNQQMINSNQLFTSKILHLKDLAGRRRIRAFQIGSESSADPYGMSLKTVPHPNSHAEPSPPCCVLP
jgi:hypothetical protein